MLLSKECCVLVLGSLWYFGVPSQKDNRKRKKREENMQIIVTQKCPSVRDSVTQEGAHRIYKIQSNVEMRH